MFNFAHALAHEWSAHCRLFQRRSTLSASRRTLGMLALRHSMPGSEVTTARGRFRGIEMIMMAP